MKFGTASQKFTLETQRDSGVGKVGSEAARDIPVRPGNFPLVFACRTGREQHVKQMHVTRAGRGVVVIDPPRTPRDRKTIANLQRPRPLRVADPAEPAASVIVKGLDIRSHLLVRQIQTYQAVGT